MEKVALTDSDGMVVGVQTCKKWDGRAGFLPEKGADVKALARKPFFYDGAEAYEVEMTMDAEGNKAYAMENGKPKRVNPGQLVKAQIMEAK